MSGNVLGTGNNEKIGMVPDLQLNNGRRNRH